jgi:hypothetical protein
MATKKTFVDPLKVKGSTEQIVKTLLKLKPKDFPEPDKVLDLMRELKTEADQSEIRLIAYMMAYENSNLWKKSAVPCSTFDEWLKQYQRAIPDLVRYRHGVVALTEFGVEACTTHGIKVLSKVAGLPKNHRVNYIREELEPGMETRRFPLSEVTVSTSIRGYRKRHNIPSVVARVPKSNLATKLEQTEEENRRLRAEVRELKIERNDLLKRLAKYEKKAA